MSEQHLHINYSLADIERYLQGKMSSTEMYAMEKAALHDEFLADAIEGYSTASVTQSLQHLQQVREELLGKKEPAKVVPIIPTKNNWFKIAASVIAVLGVGIIAWLAVNNSSTKNNTLAKTEPAIIKVGKDSAVVAEAPLLPKEENKITEKNKPSALKAKPEILVENITTDKEAMAARADDIYNSKKEMAAVDTVNRQALKNELSRSYVADYKLITSLQKQQASELKSMPPITVDQALQSRMAGVEINQNFLKKGVLQPAKINIRGKTSANANNQPLYLVDGMPYDSNALARIKPKDIKNIEVLNFEKASAAYGARGKNGVISITTNNQTLNALRGRVTDPYGNGIANASVNIEASNKNILTDNLGNFTFSHPDTSAFVKINSIGYLPASVPVSSNLSNNIVLNPGNNALEDVIVVGYGTKKKIDITGSMSSSAAAKTTAKDSAMPVGGWQSFNSYLNQKVSYLYDTAAKSTVVIRDRRGNILDEVELEFSIDERGAPYNIKVVDDIDKDKAQTIANIVKEGPKWIGSKKKNRAKIPLKK